MKRPKLTPKQSAFFHDLKHLLKAYDAEIAPHVERYDGFVLQEPQSIVYIKDEEPIELDPGDSWTGETKESEVF